jgi:uncharacterized protein with FMN-binding domain
MQGKRIIGWGILILWLSGCSVGIKPEPITSPPSKQLHEGVFTGTNDLPTPQFIVVDVTIVDGEIVAIRLRQHPAWKKPEEQQRLLRAVVEKQTTDVYDSRNDESDQDRLLNAIEDALSKARK